MALFRSQAVPFGRFGLVLFNPLPPIIGPAYVKLGRNVALNSRQPEPLGRFGLIFFNA